MINLEQKYLLKLGKQMITLIQKRTQSGYDIEDKEFIPYSKKPFAMPVGAINKGVLKKLMYKKNRNEVIFFNKNKDKLWVVIKGGYYRYKQFAKTNNSGYSVDTVSLTMSGSMLRSLTVINASNNQIKIGFNNTDEANKAYWNIQKGRNFFGLSPNDIEKLDTKYFVIKEIKTNIAP